MFDLLILILYWIISIYATIMLFYCLCGWYIRNPENKFMKVLAFVTEPPLRPIRKLLHRAAFFRSSPVDFSPLILFLILQIIVKFLPKLMILV